MVTLKNVFRLAPARGLGTYIIELVAYLLGVTSSKKLADMPTVCQILEMVGTPNGCQTR